MKNVTLLLKEASRGDRRAMDRLMPLVVDELRALARKHMRRERPDHTLQPTALVNEVYLRLVDEKSADYRDRHHFFAIASRRMREILINHANRYRAAKRGGDRWRRILFVEGVHDVDEKPLDLADLLALDEALARLESRSGERAKRMARIVEMRLFGGMSSQEIADHLGLSARTVERELKAAITVLIADMGEEEEPSNGGTDHGLSR